MPRKQLSPEKRRRTISFTLTGTDIEKLDNILEIKKEKYPYAEITRKSLLEALVREYINKVEGKPL